MTIAPKPVSHKGIDLAAEIRARRARLNMTQGDVAAIANVERVTISRIEAGQDARFQTIAKIVGALGLSIVLTEAA